MLSSSHGPIGCAIACRCLCYFAHLYRRKCSLCTVCSPKSGATRSSLVRAFPNLVLVTNHTKRIGCRMHLQPGTSSCTVNVVRKNTQTSIRLMHQAPIIALTLTFFTPCSRHWPPERRWSRLGWWRRGKSARHQRCPQGRIVGGAPPEASGGCKSAPRSMEQVSFSSEKERPEARPGNCCLQENPKQEPTEGEWPQRGPACEHITKEKRQAEATPKTISVSLVFLRKLQQQQ